MNSRKVARYALLIALAMVLSWLESLVPITAAVPGMKLGLPNLVVLFALYRMSVMDAAAISLIRVLLVSFTFGNAYAFAYSFAGAVLSLLTMLVLKKAGKFSPIGVSVAGGVGHNLGQVIVAALVLETEKIFFYLPVLMVSGIAAGICIGILGGVIVDRLKTV